MKVCKYCGAENKNSAAICSSCGGREFRNKCGNCGTVFEGGNFCPNCGVKAGTKPKKCPNCGTEYYSVACPNCGYTNGRGNPQPVYTNIPAQPVKKRNTWLWVLGWIFIFPVPLTILMLRNQKLNKWVKISAIAAAWIFYLVIALTGNTEDSTSTDGKTNISDTSEGMTAAEETNIENLSFLQNEDVIVKVGETSSHGYLQAHVKSQSDFSPDDVLFVSDNPEIATIDFTKEALTTYLYFDINGISPGETTVYATSKDGSVVSEKIKVTVPKPIEIESIDVNCSKTELCLGEKISPDVSFAPSNAEDKTLSWSSSDASVALVDENGSISAVGDGTATITVRAKNGVSSAFEITVDGSKRMMRLKVTHEQQDENNIGEEWSYITQINGESTNYATALAPGDTLTFYAKFTEDDSNPDVGEASTTYTVTEEDLTNGFTVSMDLYVTENGGKNSGTSVHFIVSYIFSSDKSPKSAAISKTKKIS